MNTATGVYHWSVLYLQRVPRVSATDQAFVRALCGLRKQVYPGLLCTDTSTQVEARLHITEGRDIDVEPLSTEDRSHISFSPRNLHQSIRVPPWSGHFSRDAAGHYHTFDTARYSTRYGSVYPQVLGRQSVTYSMILAYAIHTGFAHFLD